jgi:hypothetical protein
MKEDKLVTRNEIKGSKKGEKETKEREEERMSIRAIPLSTCLMHNLHA